MNLDKLESDFMDRMATSITEFDIRRWTITVHTAGRSMSIFQIDLRTGNIEFNAIPRLIIFYNLKYETTQIIKKNMWYGKAIKHIV